MGKIVVVSDDAPVHTDLERITREQEFLGTENLRLTPYSAPLNPIEECWSVLKAELKKTLSETFAELMAEPELGMSVTEHRLRYLEMKINSAIPKITPLL